MDKVVKKWLKSKIQSAELLQLPSMRQHLTCGYSCLFSAAWIRL